MRTGWLLRPLLPADFHNDVATSVGVLREQQQPELFLDGFDITFSAGDFATHRLAIITGRIGEHLTSGRQILDTSLVAPDAVNDGRQLLVALGKLHQASLIGEDGGVAKPRLQLRMFMFQASQPIEHNRRGYTTVPAPADSVPPRRRVRSIAWIP